MPDKSELQMKAAEARLAALEKAIDGFRKTAAPDASAKQIGDLQKRLDALEKRLNQIDETMLTKKDKKTMEEQESANLAKAVAAGNKLREDADRLVQKQVAEIEKDLAALQVETKFKLLENRVTVLETTRR